MTNRERILTGGLGALMPVVANLAIVDARSLDQWFSITFFMGYAIKIVALVVIGGTVAYFNTDESHRFKLFQLGLGAPAFILAMQNGANVKLPELPPTHPSGAVYCPFVASTAFAQPPTHPTIKQFVLPKPEGVNGLWQGLTGQPPKNLWFVIAGSHEKPGDALDEAAAINRRSLGFSATVYAPYGNTRYYAVMVGEYLTLDQARARQEEAIHRGLRMDTYVWTFPRE